MTENECLKEVLKEFLKSINYDKEFAENYINNYTEFYDFVEDHEDLKENMYKFFYKMLDNYVLFRFYTEPIPALIENEDYMRKFKRDVRKKAYKFFNYGGLMGDKND